MPDEVGRGAATGGPGEIVGAGHRPGARGLEASLASGGVRFDVWKSEAPLHDEGWVARASSGSGRPAMSTSRTGRRVPLHQLGDDKDRLIYRSDGRPTYFAATRLRDGEVLPGASTPDLHWGVDHTGRSRNRNAAQAMGYDRSLPGLLVAGSGSWPTASRSRCRSVRDVRDPRRNARCRGTDAARVLRLRAAHVAFDFDIELRASSLRTTRLLRPVRHARIASILRKGRDAGSPRARLSGLLAASRGALVRVVARLPEVSGRGAAEETQASRPTRRTSPPSSRVLPRRAGDRRGRARALGEASRARIGHQDDAGQCAGAAGDLRAGGDVAAGAASRAPAPISPRAPARSRSWTAPRRRPRCRRPRPTRGPPDRVPA